MVLRGVGMGGWWDKGGGEGGGAEGGWEGGEGGSVRVRGGHIYPPPHTDGATTPV